MKVLRVDVDQLRQLATHVGSLADDLRAGRMTAPSGASWQASVQAAVDAHGDVVAARAAYVERMRSTSLKLAVAATAHGTSGGATATSIRT